jgi:hypothetical protein
MSTDNDVARSLRSWLRENRHEDADRVLNVVFDQIPATPQRRASWLARRSTVMSNSIRIALAAAVLVIVAFVGYQLLGGSNVGDPTQTETPLPTASPSVAPSTAPSEAAGLPLGPFDLAVAGGILDVPMTVTIGAPDWLGEIGGGILIHAPNTNPPYGAGLIVFTGQLEVYGDPCRWQTTRPDPMTAPTVDAVIAALAAQSLRNATAPVDIILDGYSGKSIQLSVPIDANLAACDGGQFRSWGPEAMSRYHQGPGQIDQVWVVDVDGTLVTIDAARYAQTPAEVHAEMDAIVQSVTFN